MGCYFFICELFILDLILDEEFLILEMIAIGKTVAPT